MKKIIFYLCFVSIFICGIYFPTNNNSKELRETYEIDIKKINVIIIIYLLSIIFINFLFNTNSEKKAMLLIKFVLINHD